MLNDMVTQTFAKHAQCNAGVDQMPDQFRQFAESFPQMVWVVSGEGAVAYANRQWACYCGNHYAENGIDWRASVHPDDLPGLNYRWARLVAAGEPLQIELRLFNTCASAYRWFLCHGKPLHGCSVAGGRWLVTATDIHDVKKTAEDLRKTKDDLEAINQARDEFLSAISHELRTPLNAILGWTQLLQTDMLEVREMKAAVDCIEQNAKAQAQLVEDILDVTRAVNNKLRIDPKPMDVRVPVWAAVETIRPMADAEHVAIHVELPETPVWISADQGRMQQVVWNLLSNAVKFTDPGGDIRVVLQATGQHIRLTVSDTGRGIAPEMLSRIFERFVQADDTTTRKQLGLGLGLQIVKHVVELHDGSVFAQSDGTGKGATFTVILPQHATPAATAPTPASPHAGLFPGLLKDVKVVIIDDEPFSRELVATTLRKVGAEAKTAGAAQQAYALIAEFRPHVVVCDIGMPIVDGYTLVQQLRTMDESISRTPAIALTGYASSDDRVRALAAGFNKHVPKPVSSAELVRAVRELAPSAIPPTSCGGE